MIYTLVRSNRKTIAIEISRTCEIIVRAPKKCSKKYIEDLLLEKNDWILKHIKKMILNDKKSPPVSLQTADSLLYFGNLYPVRHTEKQIAVFVGGEFLLPYNLSNEELQQACIHMYKKLLHPFIREKVRQFAPLMNVLPETVVVTSAKKRWGSCSRKKVNFSWMLALAEPELIDYVVVHELAHILVPNHSALFWNTVSKMVPDYKRRKKKLEGLYHTIVAVGLV